jgi:hypothetical protein
MSSRRVFSIEEVNALVPKLHELVGGQLARAQEIQGLAAQLHRSLGPSERPEAGGFVNITPQPTDAPEIRTTKRLLAARIQAYQDGWRQVQALGAVIKDPTGGLLDFYGRIDDRLVWLCWKYPEPVIDHYHELDAGFSGRKPLEDVRKRMLN